MTTKRKPHHELRKIQAKFAGPDTLEITTKALTDAQAIGFGLEDIVDVVQALTPRDFVKSETAHSPGNSRVWHDTYNIAFEGLTIYLKFAGETLLDLVVTSFKEK